MKTDYEGFAVRCGGVWRRWSTHLTIVAAILVVGCGAATKVDPGSETHWLQSCGGDADCDVGRCECGICTTECQTDDECVVMGAAIGVCVRATDTDLSCGAAVGATTRICATLASISDTTGEGSNGSNTDATIDQITSSDAQASDTTTVDDDSTSADATSSDVASSDATSSDATSSDATTEPLELCDGSNDVRFLMTNAGGFVDIGYEFYGTYGHQFLAIDGTCHFYALTYAGQAVHEGQLTPEQALQLSGDLAFGRLGNYSDMVAEQCPDGTITTLWDPSGKTECGCICDSPEQPAVWTQAIAKVREWVPVLYAAGEPYAGALHRVYRATDPEMPSTESALRWPLPGEPTEVLAFDDYDFVAAARAVDLDEDRRLLREMRAEWSLENESTLAIMIFAPLLLPGGIGQAYYEVYLKDVLPEHVDARLEEVTGYTVPALEPN